MESLEKKQEFGSAKRYPSISTLCSNNNQNSCEYKQLEMLKNSYQRVMVENQGLKKKVQQSKIKYARLHKDKRALQEKYQQQKSEWYREMVSNKFELSKCTGIIRNVLNEQQLTQILANSQIDQEKCCWNIVPFYAKDKNLQFPKLSKKKSQARIISQNQRRQIVCLNNQNIIGTPYNSLLRRQSVQQNSCIKEGPKSIQKLKEMKNIELQKKRIKTLSQNQPGKQVIMYNKVCLLPVKDKQRTFLEDLKKNNKCLRLRQKSQVKKQIAIDFVKQQ